jgi:hypothetical protein
MGQKSEITGKAGATPPPDAPIETAQPLQPGTLAHQQQQARTNERTLPPFAPRPSGPRQAAPPAQTAPPAPAAVTTTEAAAVDRLVEEFFGDTPPPPAAPPPSPATVMPSAGLSMHDSLVSADVDQLEDRLPALTAEERARMPAASDSDSPARGILPNLTPPAQPDKFEGISRGGFTDVGDAQYFPLDGSELGQLALGLCDTLAAQIPNDLRFQMALVYPRVRAKLTLEIEGSVDDRDAGFKIEKIFVPQPTQPGSTPIDVARQRGTDIVFVVDVTRQEFTPEGDVDRPPDQIREELGLPIPRKQILTDLSGMRQTMVDVVHPGADAQALTR